MKTRTLSKQTIGKTFLGLGLSLAIVAGSTLVAAPAISEDEPPTGVTVSSASAAFLNAAVGGTSLTEALNLASLSATGTRDASSSADRSLLLAPILDSLNSAVGLLPDVTTSFLNVADVRQLVQAQDDGTAYASSAAVSGNAPAQLGLSGLPTNARIDLAGLLGNDLSNEIAQLVLELNALSSSAQGTGLTLPTGNYNIAGARLVLKSNLLEDLATTLSSDLIRPIDQTVGTLIGTNGALTKVINGLGEGVNTLLAILGTSITPTLAIDLNLERVVNDILNKNYGSQGVTINLSKGLVTLDLDQLLGGPGSLNNLAPNTSLLTADTVAIITQSLTTAVTDLVTSLLAGVTDSLHHTKLKVGLDVRVLGFSTVLPPVAQLTLNINMSLGELITGKPLAGETPGTAYISLAFGGIGSKLDIAKTTSALMVPVNNLLFAPKTGILGTLSRTILPGTVNSLKGVLDPVLMVVRNLVDIKVNVQQYAGNTASPTNAFTQTALQVTVLGMNAGGGGGTSAGAGTNSPMLAPLVELSLASSSVQASVVNPTVAAHPVARGSHITVQGGSFDTATSADLRLFVMGTNGPELLAGPITTAIVDEEFTSTEFEAPQYLPPGTQLMVQAESSVGTYNSPIFVPTTSPTLSGPNRIVQGDSLTTAIQDFTDTSAATLELVDVNGTKSALATGTINARNVTWPNITIPATTPAGTAKLIASSVAGDYAEYPFTIEAAPQIAVVPLQVTQGESFQVTGTGFAPNTSVVVTHTPTGAGAQGSRDVSVTTDSQGSFSSQQIATAEQEPVGEGNVVARGTGNRSATGKLTVLAKPQSTELTPPEINATPAQVLHGDTVAISGDNFVPNTEIVLTYRDSNNDVIGQSQPIETNDGTIETTLVIPQNAAIGAVSLRARSNIDQQAATSVNLTVKAAPNAPNLRPAVSVTPKTFVAGKTPLALEATGLPNGTADITITGPNGFLAVLRGATVTDNGLTTQYQPVETWPVGSYRVRVVSNESPASAADTFSVTPATDQQTGTGNNDTGWTTDPLKQPTTTPVPTPTTPNTAPSDEPSSQKKRDLALGFARDAVSYGDEQTAVASGFQSGEIVSIYLGTDKLLLPNATANADGEARWQFDISEVLASGQYTATARSVSKADSVQAQFTITEPDLVAAPVGKPVNGTTSGGYVYVPQTVPGVPTLAKTGLESSAAKLGALALLFLVVGAVLTRRRSVT